ncbi:MAG: hypothetical protein H7Z40_12315 [Phycisphaerae bacterium]|nr:hypothetical protein [Gemmatimonadaceae bacterium]
MFAHSTITRGIAALFAGAVFATVTTEANAQPLRFADVVTNAAGFSSSPFTTYNGYTFENFGVRTTASTFGSGSNALSPTKFAYAQADGSSFIYRTDIGFNFFTAYLSFRQLDLDAVSPRSPCAGTGRATSTARSARTCN